MFSEKKPHQNTSQTTISKIRMKNDRLKLSLMKQATPQNCLLHRGGLPVSANSTCTTADAKLYKTQKYSSSKPINFDNKKNPNIPNYSASRANHVEEQFIFLLVQQQRLLIVQAIIPCHSNLGCNRKVAIIIARFTLKNPWGANVVKCEWAAASRKKNAVHTWKWLNWFFSPLFVLVRRAAGKTGVADTVACALMDDATAIRHAVLNPKKNPQIP